MQRLVNSKTTGIELPGSHSEEFRVLRVALRVAVHFRPWVDFHRHAATLKSLNSLAILPITGEAAIVMANKAFDSRVTDSSLFR